MNSTPHVHPTDHSHGEDTQADAPCCVAFAIFDDGPDQLPSFWQTTHKALALCALATKDPTPGSLDRFKEAFREYANNERITEEQIDSLAKLCGQPAIIETAQKRVNLIAILPSGEIRYVTRFFQIPLGEPHWILTGISPIPIGDFTSALHCAHLLQSGQAPETFVAQFRVAKVPTSQLLFRGQAAFERLVHAHGADPTPSVLHLCTLSFSSPTMFEAHRLSLGLLGHLKAVQQDQENLDHEALAAALTTYCAAAQPVTPIQIATLLAFCAAPETDAAIMEGQDLKLALTPAGEDPATNTKTNPSEQPGD